MNEHTPAQYEQIKATEEFLLTAAAEIGAICDGSAVLSWNVASTLVGRDIDAMTVGELRKLAREAMR